jgi:hypothetical protein
MDTKILTRVAVKQIYIPKKQKQKTLIKNTEMKLQNEIQEAQPNFFESEFLVYGLSNEHVQ